MLPRGVVLLAGRRSGAASAVSGYGASAAVAGPGAGPGPHADLVGAVSSVRAAPCPSPPLTGLHVQDRSPAAAAAPAAAVASETAGACASR